jgi:hypothetical protein
MQQQRRTQKPRNNLDYTALAPHKQKGHLHHIVLISNPNNKVNEEVLVPFGLIIF